MKKKVLIDIGHPAHIHLLKNLIKNSNGKIEFIVTTRDVPIHKFLLDTYRIKYILIGNKKDGLIQKVLHQIKVNYLIFKLAVKNNIDLMIGSTPSISHVSRLTKAKSILLDDDDDEVEPLIVKYIHPFTDIILSPNVIKRKSSKTLNYAGYHELAYLHPNNFLPDKNVLFEANLEPGDKYFVLRFNAFKAHHDVGAQGLTIENKRNLVNVLKPHGKIFITAERDIEPELKEYQIKIEPHKIHSFLYYATMFIGDSQTMTTEAAVLGVPALKCNSFAGRLSVPNELESKYNLCFSYLPENFDFLLKQIDILLNQKNLKEEWQKRRCKFFDDKIDVTAFLGWLLENFPNSIAEFKINPDLQYRFK